ncbi:hypothetical protein [Vagococcus silagei]|uniref:Uncharacterized protein n=1 Tax=Vagococcus silagei TaxID=2508885 RepID=A0A4S3B1Y1_9ENTE|nr:hypothetical protein [Vagococcus silagei]THB61051.1 hypothetical protein ESZ54_06875 [Vagococcus silagei]
MLRDRLYIHLDGISNSVISKGIAYEDFYRYTKRRPSNIILLNPNEREGEYETHTNFRVVRGEEAVNRYFKLISSRPGSETCWIDFKDYDVLSRLTDNEIAELLYFGHMKTQLRSPFFYKLQNNYVFFEFTDDLSKVYFRNIDEFYSILSQKMTEKVMQKINISTSFFRRRLEIEEVSIDLVSQLKATMQEGIVFDFSQVGLKNNQYFIPIFVVEDNLRKVDNQRYRSEDKIGTLVYNHRSKEWSVEKEQYESLFMKQ